VFEAPPGLKANLQRTYATWSADFLAGQAPAVARRSSRSSDGGATPGTGRNSTTLVAPGRVPLRAQLLFLLAWFNAVLQERRNYVPIVSCLRVLRCSAVATSAPRLTQSLGR
jgi:dynein heavy chain 2